MKNIYSYSLLFLLGVNLFVWGVIFAFIHHPLAEVDFLNVGQGDAELIQMEAGNILIDAGPNREVVSALDQVLPFFDRTIDVFILSHPNQDHYAGFFDVLDRYQVRAVMLNNLDCPDSLYQQLLQEIRRRNITVLSGLAGTRIRSKDSPDQLLILYPLRWATMDNNVNEFSSVDILSLYGKQFLFTGDMGFREERKVIPFLSLLPAGERILKVAHHGSRYASSQMFLKAFAPQIAVIEVGNNNYSHPHPDTLQRLKDAQVKVLRTDLDGLIRFIFPSSSGMYLRSQKF